MSRFDPVPAAPRHIAVVGAGIVGLSTAHALLASGAEVTVYAETGPERRASHAAAGMLAPAYEAGTEDGAHPDLLALCLAAGDYWRDFAPMLEAATGLALDYRPGPALAVGRIGKDADRLDRLAGALSDRGIAFDRLDRSALKAAAPQLSPDFDRALVLPSDAGVDNRAVLKALERAVFDQGGAKRICIDDGKAPDIDDLLRANDAAVLATGWRLAGMMPVKGAALALKPGAGLPDKVVRWGRVYLAPKHDRVVLGATAEPGASDSDPARSDLDELLAEGAELCPAVAHGDVIERWAGVRPCTPDLAPVLGWRRDGVYVAGGHYRNGILLGPLTGKLVAEHILSGDVPPLIAPFGPQRFAPEAV